MTYYDDIVRLLNAIEISMFYFDNIDIGERDAARLEHIQDKIELLQMKVNQQVTEFHDWVMQRKNLI